MTVPGPFTMSQQAQNDHYPDAESAAMAYAAAVNAEIKDLHAAGADIVQIDEPYMQARPDAARAYGLAALQRALEGVTGTTAVHICFGYAAIIHERPEGYSFLPELAGCSADQISIETAQSGLDLGVLKDLSEKTIILGVIDLSDHEVESAETVADRVRRAFPTPPRPDHHRHRLRDEVPPARQCRGQDARHGRGRARCCGPSCSGLASAAAGAERGGAVVAARGGAVSSRDAGAGDRTTSTCRRSPTPRCSAGHPRRNVGVGPTARRLRRLRRRHQSASGATTRELSPGPRTACARRGRARAGPGGWSPGCGWWSA